MQQLNFLEKFFLNEKLLPFYSYMVKQVLQSPYQSKNYNKKSKLIFCVVALIWTQRMFQAFFLQLVISQNIHQQIEFSKKNWNASIQLKQDVLLLQLKMYFLISNLEVFVQQDKVKFALQRIVLICIFNFCKHLSLIG